jgi:hypothetical protein
VFLRAPYFAEELSFGLSHPIFLSKSGCRRQLPPPGEEIGALATNPRGGTVARAQTNAISEINQTNNRPQHCVLESEPSLTLRPIRQSRGRVGLSAADVARFVQRSTSSSDVPVFVEDTVVLEHLARVLS